MMVHRAATARLRPLPALLPPLPALLRPLPVLLLPLLGLLLAWLAVFPARAAAPAQALPGASAGMAVEVAKGGARDPSPGVAPGGTDRSAGALHPDDVPPPAWAPVPFLRPADFMLYMQQQHGWTKDTLEPLFAGYQANPQVIRLMDPGAPGFKRSWQAYRKRFIEPRRIAYGKAFWDDNANALERASRRFGVPPYVVVGIIGVETVFGRHTGTFGVLEALSTLSFDYPRRAAYFARELEHFLLWTRAQGVDPASVKGSFAGAIGLPQFMPGSIRRHALDFDGDGTVDLGASAADAIGSVASFLRGHGWDADSTQDLRRTLTPLPEVNASALLEGGWRPHATRRAIEEAGLRFAAQAAGPASATQREAAARWAVFELPNGDAPSTWIATDHNFWVITRYNQSPFYAMAVLELGEAVRAARLKNGDSELAGSLQPGRQPGPGGEVGPSHAANRHASRDAKRYARKDRSRDRSREPGRPSVRKSPATRTVQDKRTPEVRMSST